jgi:hypothetical protein
VQSVPITAKIVSYIVAVSLIAVGTPVKPSTCQMS